MNTRYLLPMAHFDVSKTPRGLEPSGASANFDAPQTAAAARIRISTAARESRRRKLSANGAYYGTKPTGAQLEETIDELASGTMDAIVTRHHSGCLVLNAARQV